jgi:hypothetical protein
MDGQTDLCMHIWKLGWMDGKMGGWIDAQIDEDQTDNGMNGEMEG